MTATIKKIYHVHFRYLAHKQVRFASHAVAADAPSMATRRLLEHVRELHACDTCEGTPAAPGAFRHRTKRRVDHTGPKTECEGTVEPLAEADVRGHPSVHFVCESKPSGDPVTIKIGEQSFTYNQPGNEDNPDVLR